MTKPTTRKQTTRINGARVVITTSASGKVTVKPADVLEIDLQAAAVRALKKLPGYVDDARNVTVGSFALAADQNGSGFRGRNAAVKLKAAGMAAGEPDVRVYLSGGTIKLIEFKGAKGKLEPSQEKRFPMLRALGFEIAMVEAATEDEAASRAIALVLGWLADNDDDKTETKEKSLQCT